MGTLFRIKLYAPDPAVANAAFRATFDRIAQLDNILSDYKPDSELSRLPSIAAGHAVAVSTDLFRVVAAAQDTARETGGAFDITLGPVIRLWREARKTGVAPSLEALRQAGTRCGYQYLKLARNPDAIELLKPGMALDAGGIAKGYAADEALAVLSARGIHSALVAASGDLALSDAPPGTTGWRVGVDSLDSARASFTKVLNLANAAVSTSGDTEQHLDANGQRYSHIINPKTLMGLTSPVTVTVVARRGITADSFATALSVLGPEAALQFADRMPGIAALIVLRTHEKPQVFESKAFQGLAGKQ